MILLDELMNAKDFDIAVNGLAREFRDAHQLPAIEQLGVVVPDVVRASENLEAQGIGPFLITHISPVLWRERGEERRIRGKLALAYHQDYELELLEPAEGSDFYGRRTESEGRMLVQHLGMLVEDVDAYAERLNASGVETWVRGRLKIGPLLVDFAYMDTVEETGIIVEFISWRLYGRLFKMPAGIVKVAGQVQKWSGKRRAAV